MADYYTLLTNIGQAKIANASANEEHVSITELAVGDGDGEEYNPISSQTELQNEVWRDNIESISIDEDNDNWIVIEAVVPSDNGGFTVREVGVFDQEGDLIAIGKYPETYKPEMEEGSAKDLYIRMIIEVSNAETVEMNIDPSVIIATREYVNERVGDPNELDTNEKANTVAAINEVNNKTNSHISEKVQDDGGVHGIAVEEGVFTPNFVGDTDTTYVRKEGYYHKMGKIVHITCLLEIDVLGTSTNEETEVGGIPFLVKEISPGSLGSITDVTLDSDTFGIGIQGRKGYNTAVVTNLHEVGTANFSPSLEDFLNDESYINFSLSYVTDDE